jgi:alkylation response protein AidB-like acyl-CoA dehydrogenase
MERPAAMTQPAATPEIPDLLYGEAENDLRQAVRSFLAERCRPADVLARTESSEPYDTALWHALAADLGCAGLLVPESLGGAGASYREAAVVAEETGRSAAPVPYLGSAVVATAALLSAAGPEPAAEEDRKLLAALADGSVTAALAVPFESAPGGELPRAVRVTGPAPGDPAAGSARLAGAVARLADALPADVLLVPADGVPYGLYAVDAHAGGVTRTPAVSLDGTRQLCDLTLDAVPARQVAAADAAVAAVRAGLSAGAALLAAEQLGLAERCLEMTVGYVKERRQFARPVGSFQAVKHRLADLYVLVAQARAASRYAAACLADGSPDAPVAVAMAKAYCGDAAVKAAEECVQLHGGIGFTWEHPAHLYLKRAKSGSIAFGTPDRHRAALAALVNLPGTGGGTSA